MSEYIGRYCSHFYCDKVRERRCCVDCEKKTERKYPCLNDPSRCRMEGEGPEAKFSKEAGNDYPEK